MPKSYYEIANILGELLEKSGKDIITVPWSDAYQMTDTKRWAERRTEEIISAAYEIYGIVVAYGDSGLFVMKDENFAPASG